MTNPLAQDLGGVVRLLEKFNAGAFSHQERIDFEHACVEFIRTHSAEIAGALRDAGGWQPIESAPRDGTHVLVANSHGSWIAAYHPVYKSGYRPSKPWASMMLNHDHIAKPWRFDPPTHWRPLPAPPAQDSAMQQGGGGGE